MRPGTPITIHPAQPDRDHSMMTGMGTRVTDAQGNEISGVMAVDVSFRVDDVVRATVQFVPGVMKEAVAEGHLSLENVVEAADAYGYCLLSKEQAAALLQKNMPVTTLDGDEVETGQELDFLTLDGDE